MKVTRLIGKTVSVGLCLALLLTTFGATTAFAAEDTPLADAAMRNDLTRVQALLGEGVDVNAAQGDGNTALHWAAYHSNAEMAEVLIGAGANVTAQTRIGELTPMFLVARTGYEPIVRLLLDAGADPRATTSTGTTALMLAAGSGKTETVAALIEAGSDVNSRELVNGQTAVMFAAALNRGAAITMLASHDADLNVVTKLSQIATGDSQRRVNSRRQSRPAVTMGGNSALHYASRDGQMDAVRALVEAGADVNVLTGNDRTPPITQALITGNLDLAKFMLDHGADPTIANADGLTPLYATLDAQFAQRTWYPPPSVEQEKTNYIDLMRDLLGAGADPNAPLTNQLWYRQFGNSGSPNRVGSTPFWRATQAHDLAAMNLLLDIGADPNIYTDADNSPLMVASGIHFSNQGLRFVADARLAVVRFLVEELGADPTWKDANGHTSLHGAALIGRNDIIDYLVAAGGDVTVQANMISGNGDGGGSAQEVDPGTGDSPADMANGWTMNSPQHPETVTHLLDLGAPFRNKCWASTCVNPTIPDDPKEPEGQQD